MALKGLKSNGFDQTKRFRCAGDSSLGVLPCKSKTGGPRTWASYNEAVWHQRKTGHAIECDDPRMTVVEVPRGSLEEDIALGKVAGPLSSRALTSRWLGEAR